MFQRIKIRLLIYKNYFTLLLRKGIIRWPFSKNTDHNKSIFFDLKDLRQEPYYYPIIYALHQNGYRINIANNPLFIGHIFGPGRLIYELQNVKIDILNTAKDNLIVFDYERNEAYRNASLKMIKLNHKFLVRNNQSILPYPMHPNVYHSGLYKSIEKLRSAKRSFRTMFSGNIEPEAYQSALFKKNFDILNRVEIINSIKKNFSKEQVFFVAKENLCERDNLSYFNGILLNYWEWSRTHSSNMEVKIQLNDWLAFLAKTDFFIACPGISIPFSHNAIEAMSVGTIPILNYAHCFTPELEDGKNCILFSNEKNMVERLKAVLAMSNDEILELRKNVIDYYETHLNYLTLIPQLFSNGTTRSEYLFINEAL